MSDIYKIPENYASEALIDEKTYVKMYTNQLMIQKPFGKSMLKE